MCLPRSLPTSSPRRRGQRGARAAQRARTTLTLTSGDARSATRKALAGQHAQRRPIRAQPNCLEPLKNRRKTGTNHRPVAPVQNLCLRRRNPSSNPCGDPHSCRKTPKRSPSEALREDAPGRAVSVVQGELPEVANDLGRPVLGLLGALVSQRAQLFEVAKGSSARCAGAASFGYRCGMGRHSSRAGQRASQQHLDLGVDASELVVGPTDKRVVDGRIEAKQDLPALAHV